MDVTECDDQQSAGSRHASGSVEHARASLETLLDNARQRILLLGGEGCRSTWSPRDKRRCRHARKARLHADWAVAYLGGAAVGVDGADVVRETASIGNF